MGSIHIFAKQFNDKKKRNELFGIVPEREHNVASAIYSFGAKNAKVEVRLRLESLGIKGDEIETLGVNEQFILREFNDSIQFVEKRYCVKLPWIEGMQERLGNNNEVVLKRLNTLVKRFKRDSSWCKEYREVVDGYLKEGIVELSDDLEADVKQAFLQNLIDPEDRQFTTFFWIEDLNSDNFCVLNFTRVLFGLKPSPYLLSATLKYHFEKYQHLFPETCEMLKNSFWVDDLVGGVDDLETALKISAESVEVMKRAGMMLKKWQTNSLPLRERYKQSGIETDDTKDASMKAYDCVVYSRGTTRESRVITSFICSKGRVAPIKSFRMPCLELLGCLLSDRLAKQPKILCGGLDHLGWSQPNEFWPSMVENEKPTGDLEIRNEVEIISQCKCDVYDSDFVLDLNKYYNDLNRVLKIAVLVTRFVSKLKKKLPVEFGSYTATELAEAELDCVK
ncbi:hypothetical protein HNY73_004888 [Argiope bruennichi]|uniref:Uncharacterized protein n=1 Tax=Argiope bruennichi TaxID=94029 RepID=A0A8T0FRF2_ARGBR|nr:hypothetical protein HNY73_004888 [Argiope bruennichi]